MQCRSVLTRIDALRTGELETPDSEGVRDHMKRCSSCADSLSDIEQFAHAVRSMAIEPPQSCADAVTTAVCDSFGSFELDGKRVWVAFSNKGIRLIDFRSQTETELRASYRSRFDRDLRPQPIPPHIQKAVEAALRGEKIVLPTVDLEGLTEFEQQVLNVITAIPRGEVRTYEWVACAAGRPKAVRAVGNIMAMNPVPFVLPCHRVIPSAGGIGNYGYGPAMKRTLLAAESAPVDEIDALARKGVRYIGSRTTKIFCFPTCKDARRIRDDNRVPFHDAREAERDGYRPCKRCAPVVAA